MTVTVVLFTSDLRLHDHPPLNAGLEAADEVMPLFVLDPGVHTAGFDAPNRRAFLADCLRDLATSLRHRGGRLMVRLGTVVRGVCAVATEHGATEVHMAAGVTAYAHRREEWLCQELGASGVTLRVHEAVSQPSHPERWHPPLPTTSPCSPHTFAAVISRRVPPSPGFRVHGVRR